MILNYYIYNAKRKYQKITLMTAFIRIILFASLIILFSIHFNNRNATLSHGNKGFTEDKTEALGALQMLSQWNAFPGIDIPPDGYAKAWEYYKSNFLNRNFKNSTGSWRSLGPVNTGGRTISIAIDPVDTSIIWLGSASGGLWKSTTGGVGIGAWQYIPTGYPVMGVGGIAIDPTNTKVMYIGTGETYNYGSSTLGIIDRTTRGSYGVGILKSTDGGVNWHPTLNWIYQQNRGVWKIIINPQKHTTVYAATTEGVYRTLDSGHTWKNVLPQNMVMDLAIDTKDTNIIYAGVGNLNSANKGIYQTLDGGNTWNLLTNGLPANTQQGRINIAIYPKNPKIIMAHICDVYNTIGIYKSNDQGKTWNQTAYSQDIASYQGWYAKGLMMKADDSSQVIAAGVYLYNSGNGGDTFGQNQAVHADFHDIISNPKDPNKIYTICDGGLFRSNDFGKTYYDCNNGYVTTQFYIGSVYKHDSTNMIGGIQDNYSQKLQQDNYWMPVVGGDGSYNAIDQNDGVEEFASYQYLNVFESFDEGKDFYTEALYNPSDPTGGNPAAFLAPFILCPSNQNVVYAGANYMLKSTDAFTTNSPIGPALIDSGNPILAIAASNSSTDSLYCATGASSTGHMHVYRSEDGGTTYTNISNGLPNRIPRRIVVDPKRSNVVYIIFAGFGTGHIFRSVDAGDHWKDISTTLPNLPFHCLAIDPAYPNMIYAGCDFTVFLSKDTGATWAAFETGLPDAAMIFDLVISPDNRSLLAFSYGHGVYTRGLNDISSHTNSVENSIQPGDLKIYPNPATNYIYLDFHDPVKLNDPIEILDLSGKVVYSQSVSGSSSVIKTHLQNLKPGVYFIRVNVNGNESVKKFLITGS